MTYLPQLIEALVAVALVVAATRDLSDSRGRRLPFREHD